MVSYHDVRVEVPRAWPVVDGIHTGFCRGPFRQRPTAFVGPQDEGAPSCPLPIGTKPPAYDGVWLQVGYPPPGTKKMTTPSGQVVFRGNPDLSEYPVKVLWFHHVSLEIGRGPDLNIAQEIVDSIRFTPGAPDTSATGVCVRSPHPNVMPSPERVARRLVLDRGTIVLDPPKRSDSAVMFPAQAWKESEPAASYERYRVVLSRYSAKFPALDGPDGSLIPLEYNILAWVVYSSPRSPTIAGCGGWGVEAFDATTGGQITSDGYAPGP